MALLNFLRPWAKSLRLPEAPRVLMYHMVNPHLSGKYYQDGQKIKNYLRVEPEMLEQQIIWLKQEGFSFYKMEDIIKPNLPEKSVFLTFDDGYEDNYIHLFPLLKKHHACATIYLVVNRFKNDWATDRMCKQISTELNDQPMLSHQQVEEMINSNLIEFGGHCLDHVRLHELSKDEAQQQIKQGRQALIEKYNIDCNSFAYPFGFYNQQAIELVQEAGFSNACTTEDGVDLEPHNKPYELRRLMVSGNHSLGKFKSVIMRTTKK